jgi:hypothetical protein
LLSRGFLSRFFLLNLAVIYGCVHEGIEFFLMFSPEGLLFMLRAWLELHLLLNRFVRLSLGSDLGRFNSCPDLSSHLY